MLLPNFLVGFLKKFNLPIPVLDIAEGIVWGMVSFVALKLLSGKHKEISITMYILAALFIIKILVT